MKPDRKTFLSGLAVAALAPAAASAAPVAVASPTPKPSASPKPSAGRSGFPYTFDRARFEALTKSDARYRHFVAATKINQGRVFDVVSTIFGSYTTDVGVPANDVVVGTVLYHGAPVALGLNDAAWKEYVFPSILQLNEDEIRDDLASVQPTSGGNPMDRQIAEIAKNDNPIFVCRWAFGGMVRAIASALKKDPNHAYEALSSSLLPNAMLVPSGVWAIAELQHRGFSYQQATL